ncbi:protein of unknown function [Methylorubrum extorquens]|uniref:Uncharacterized protein n=1 Tax=Methylorubrum extorquens TaxID=408 RepID=A0A2N9ASG2_METEX|nr:protein of unknown function [Methylorubrum extorquens]
MQHEASPLDLTAARERLEAEVNMLSVSHMAHKRQGFILVLGDSHPFHEVDEASLFERVFGDRLGRDYWQWWFEDDASPLYLFAGMLAAHNAKAAPPDERDNYLKYLEKHKPQDLREGLRFWAQAHEDPLKERHYNSILAAFQQAAINGDTWLRTGHDRPDGFDDLLRGQFAAVRNTGLLVRRRSAALWLANHSEFRSLLPRSARDFLLGSPPADNLLVDAGSPPPVAKLAGKRGRPKGQPYAEADRALFPVVEDMMRNEGITLYAASQKIADKLAGTGTLTSRAIRFRGFYKSQSP